MTKKLQPLSVLFFTTMSLPVNSFAASELQSQSRMEQLMAMELGDVLKIEIATGSAIDIRQAPAVASVITAADIRLMGARNLMEVLDTVPGLHVARNGQNMTPEFWFRGITSTYTPQALLMINGVSIKSVVRGDSHTFWGEFPVHSIARIEVIRGPGSALYGADAFSGVINIISKDANDISRPEAGVTIGSFNTVNLWANTATKFHDWSLGLSLEYTESDGYDSLIETDAQTLIDEIGDLLFATGALPFDPADASLTPIAMNLEFKSIDLWFNAENDFFRVDLGIQDRDDLGGGQGATEVIDPTASWGGYRQLLKAEIKPYKVSENFKLGAEIHYYRSAQEMYNNQKLFPPGAFFGAFPDGFIGNPGWEEATTKFEIKTSYSGWQNHHLSAGIGFNKQDLYQVTETKNFNPDLSPHPAGIIDVSDTPEIYMPEADRSNAYLYFQDLVNLSENWQLTAGLRVDDYTDFGATTNPRLSLVWNTSNKVTTKLLYGRAFRSPAFAETLTVNNPVSLGNPNLKPEIIDTIELATSYINEKDLYLGVNLFHYRLREMINFVPDSGATTATAQNVGERTGKGLELEVNYKVSEGWQVEANYAYVKATDDLVNDDVGEYPNHQAYFRSNWLIANDWKFHIQAAIVGERERIPGDFRPTLDGYTSIDAGVHYHLQSTGISIELLARNMFDADVREPSTGTTDGVTTANIPNDLPQAGSSFYLRLSKSF